MTVNWTQIAVEIFLLLAGFFALYWKQRVEAEHRFTKLETLVKRLGEDHVALDQKVSGISRNLSEVSGQIKRSNGGNKSG